METAQLQFNHMTLQLQKSTDSFPAKKQTSTGDVPSVSLPGGIKLVDLAIAQVTVSHLKPFFSSDLVQRHREGLLSSRMVIMPNMIQYVG